MARVVFFGTPEEALPSLSALHGAGHEVGLVITAPDAPAGRGQHLQAPPVKQAALHFGLRVLQSERVNGPEVLEEIRQVEPDACVVVAFGKILSRALLRVPRWGGINVHFSLLPQFRGAAPLERTLLAGATVTGVSVMQMTAKMDAGPVLAQAAWPIRPRDDRGTLRTRLGHLGADLLLGVLARLERGIRRQVRQGGWATYAPKVAEETYRLDWRQPVAVLANIVRAASPAPGAGTDLGGRRAKLYCATVVATEDPVPAPGTVVALLRDGMVVAGGDGSLLFREGQLEGRTRMRALALAHGLRLRPGDRLGT